MFSRASASVTVAMTAVFRLGEYYPQRLIIYNNNTMNLGKLYETEWEVWKTYELGGPKWNKHYITWCENEDTLENNRINLLITGETQAVIFLVWQLTSKTNQQE